MSDAGSHRAFRSTALVLFFAKAVSGGPAVPVEQIEQTRIVVESRDAQGRILESALGFVLDQTTVVTSYNAVKSASSLNLRSGDQSIVATRVVSCRNFMDLALVKTSEELPLEPSLAGSDTLAAGDPVYYLSRNKDAWQVIAARVKSWRDSGQGYEILQIEPAPLNVVSPLFNSSGKVVGWLSNAIAAPLKAIYQLFADKDIGLPLDELHKEGQFWSPFHSKPTAKEKDRLEVAGMKPVEGPARFPFVIELPESWAFETSIQPGRYLLLSINGRFGISIALRVVPEETEDLMAGLEKVESLMFAGIPRAEMTPYSADHFTGIKAIYDERENDREYSTTMFCAAKGGNLYVLTLTYPLRYREQIQPLSEELMASLRVRE